MSGRLLLRLGLALLIGANLAVGVAWIAHEELVAAGWLAPPPPTRIDFPPQPLPPITPPAATSSPAVADTAPEPTAVAALESPPADAVLAAAGCIAIGPYENGEEANAVRARLFDAGIASRLVEASVATEPDYVVYVQPADSRTLAHRTWRELVNQGVDAYVIPAGDRENGVSVGVFTVRELAEAQRARVAELGYTVLMQAISRSHPVYRLLVEDAPSSDALAGLPTTPCEAQHETDRGQADVAGEQPFQ